MIEMECLICHEAIKTRDVEKAVAFDREHAKTCVLPPVLPTLPIHRTEAGYPNCATCDGGGCLDCTDPA